MSGTARVVDTREIEVTSSVWRQPQEISVGVSLPKASRRCWQGNSDLQHVWHRVKDRKIFTKRGSLFLWTYFPSFENVDAHVILCQSELTTKLTEDKMGNGVTSSERRIGSGCQCRPSSAKVVAFSARMHICRRRIHLLSDSNGGSWETALNPNKSSTEPWHFCAEWASKQC